MPIWRLLLSYLDDMHRVRTTTYSALLLFNLLVLAGCGGGGGGDGNTTSSAGGGAAPAASFFDSVVYSTAANASLGTAVESASVTHHQITLNGSVLNYTASAGHLTARALVGAAPEASFFYVAYTLDGADSATRPLTFFYNGGPGSATVWLHLGSFGPRRLVTGDPSTSAATPFPLVNNAESLLDVSDLVFVDAVGSGLSEAVAPNTNQTFWGVDVDAGAFRDFIMRYLTVNNRGASPKFLFGESYGTTRSAVLANLLESAGVALKGVVLQSSVLNYNSNCGVVSVSLNCAGYLPTYAATGAWYNLVVPNPGAAGLSAFIGQERSLATGQYDPAARSFLAAGTPPGAALLTQLVNTTGASLSVWQTHFNLDPGTFQSSLIPGSLIGRYDARVSAPNGSFLASEGDPSSTFITSSFAAGISNYLANELQYTNPSTYVMLSNAINTWGFAHDGLPLPDTIPDLAAAMAQNPKLQVLSLNGYHDLATPFFVTEQDLARLGVSANVQVKFYSGGHMIYLDDTSRSLEKADLVRFYQSALQAQ